MVPYKKKKKKPRWPSVRTHVFVAGLFFKVSYSGGWVPGDFGLEPTKALYRIRTSTSKPEQGLFFSGSRTNPEGSGTQVKEIMLEKCKNTHPHGKHGQNVNTAIKKDPVMANSS